jgi:HAD superfamily hydrolase (TIGR01490 family)
MLLEGDVRMSVSSSAPNSIDDQKPTGSPEQSCTNLAVFDFDGTCIDSQSGTLFSLYLFKRGYLSVSRAARLFRWGARYLLHLPNRQEESREIIIESLNEHTVDEVKQIMNDFFEEALVRRFRKKALDEVAQRHEEGCITILLSATFSGIAAPAARYLGMDVCIATEMETDGEGKYTGKVLGPVIAGKEKPRAVERWANEHLGQGAWRILYAYGDHHTDEYLLERAVRPFVVSPGKTLKQIAKRRGWPIVDWSR